MAHQVKEPTYNTGDTEDPGSIPRSRRCPGEGNGNPLHCSCLVNPMVRGAWQAVAQRIANSQT